MLGHIQRGKLKPDAHLWTLVRKGTAGSTIRGSCCAFPLFNLSLLHWSVEDSIVKEQLKLMTQTHRSGNRLPLRW